MLYYCKISDLYNKYNKYNKYNVLLVIFLLLIKKYYLNKSIILFNIISTNSEL